MLYNVQLKLIATIKSTHDYHIGKSLYI